MKKINIKKILKRVYKKIKKAIRLASIYIFTFILSILFKLDNKKVLFLSDARSVLGGNLHFVYEYIKEQDFKIIISLIEGKKKILKDVIKLLYNISTAKYIILDDYCAYISFTYKRKNQEICQLWHGAGAFKKFGHSRNDKKKIKKILAGHRNYTKACVTSENIRWCYAAGFGMDIEKVKATGMARTDIFFDKTYMENKQKEFFEKYPFLKNKKIILFAPTYRGERLTESFYDYEKIDVEEIYNKLKKENYVFIFKWHPGLYSKMKNKGELPYDFEHYTDFYYDFSENRDINDLLLITDILITDYSSVIFDYALLNKPLIYFAYDYEEYKNNRGLYFDFDDYVYGDIAQNTSELISSIKSAKVMEEKKKIFIDKFMSACDGNSTKKTCEWIFENDIKG